MIERVNLESIQVGSHRARQTRRQRGPLGRKQCASCASLIACLEEMLERLAPVLASRVIVSEAAMHITKLVGRDRCFELLPQKILKQRMVNECVALTCEPGKKNILAHCRLKLLYGDIQSERFVQYVAGTKRQSPAINLIHRLLAAHSRKGEWRRDAGQQDEVNVIRQQL